MATAQRELAEELGCTVPSEVCTVVKCAVLRTSQLFHVMHTTASLAHPPEVCPPQLL